MLNQERVDELRQMLCDRLTPEELIEYLGVTTGEVFDKFVDNCIETDWDAILD